MKQIVIAIFILLIGFNALSQKSEAFPKTIDVSGSAEMEIAPDEIYVVVTLKEYEKKGTGKIGLEKIKSDFLNYCKSIGLPDSAISIAAYEGNDNPDWWKKRKSKDELLRSISYQVKFTTSKKMDELVDKLDDAATENFVIARVSHSKIAEYRMQLKIQAVKAARNKGGYLAEAVGEKLGEAVSIVEPGENDNTPYYLSQISVSNTLSRAESSDGSVSIDFKKIKLRYEIRASFALK